MAHLVLTVVGDDRAGLVSALARTIADHDGNWEKSELAELAGAFAGIVLVSVPDERQRALTAALGELDGLLRVTTHDASPTASADASHSVSFTVLGNDRPGIVRDHCSHRRSRREHRRVPQPHLEAPMAGGTLFEAVVEVSLPAHADAAALTGALEARR
jgi:glycine cleavage system regulatory protein